LFAYVFAGLLADCFRDVEHVLRLAVGGQGAGVGDASDDGLDGDFGFGGEFLLGVVGEEDVGSAAVGGFDFGLEFVGFHGGSVWRFRSIIG